jgi:hypothetical protein
LLLIACIKHCIVEVSSSRIHRHRVKHATLDGERPHNAVLMKNKKALSPYEPSALDHHGDS